MPMKEEYNDIDNLIISYLMGDLDNDSLLKLEQWSLESESNRMYVRSKLEVLFSSGVSSDKTSTDVEEAFARFQKRVKVSTVKNRQVRFKAWKTLYRVAAVLLVLLLPLATYYKGKDTVKQNFSDIVVEASQGTQTKLNLPDGTSVWLNSGSKITYSQGFGVNDRKVVLEGEGYFEVVRNEELPFELLTKEVSLRVLGTKFNFRNYADDEEVVVCLMEGKVALRNEMRASAELYLDPNEKMVQNKATGEMRKLKTDAGQANAWKENRLFFDEELLKDIAKKLMRSYGVRIEVADTLRDRRFYGDFVITKNTIDEILSAMAKTRRVCYRYEDGKYILY